MDEMLISASKENLLRLLEEHTAQSTRLVELEKQTACTMGVGSGDGRLFVHGDHESIKAAQAIVIERDEFAARIAELEQERERLREAVQVESSLRAEAEREVAENDAAIAVWRGRTQRAESDLEACRKDAERWRYFRDRLGEPDDDVHVVFSAWYSGEGPIKDVETAIDAAMQEGGV